MNRILVISTLLFTLVPSTLLGWGPEGHEIVAKLAQTRLSDGAIAGIRSLIGDASLASIANWADEVRSERHETYGWHFADIPKDAHGFSRQRDCFTPASRSCDRLRQLRRESHWNLRACARPAGMPLVRNGSKA